MYGKPQKSWVKLANYHVMIDQLLILYNNYIIYIFSWTNIRNEVILKVLSVVSYNFLNILYIRYREVQ